MFRGYEDIHQMQYLATLPLSAFSTCPKSENPEVIYPVSLPLEEKNPIPIQKNRTHVKGTGLKISTFYSGFIRFVGEDFPAVSFLLFFLPIDLAFRLRKVCETFNLASSSSAIIHPVTSCRRNRPPQDC